jgi:plasmid stability protein
MATVIVRNLSEAAHRALKRRAKSRGRSMAAEIRDILDQAVKTDEPALFDSQRQIENSA